MSAVKTDLNPGDVGTHALGDERFWRMRAMVGLGTELADTCSLVNWHDASLVEADSTSSCKSATC